LAEDTAHPIRAPPRTRFIFAFEKTGLLVTDLIQHLLPDYDLAEWDAAIEDYEKKNGQRR
jgi:hypothetical protein